MLYVCDKMITTTTTTKINREFHFVSEKVSIMKAIYFEINFLKKFK